MHPVSDLQRAVQSSGRPGWLAGESCVRFVGQRFRLNKHDPVRMAARHWRVTNTLVVHRRASRQPRHRKTRTGMSLHEDAVVIGGHLRLESQERGLADAAIAQGRDAEPHEGKPCQRYQAGFRESGLHGNSKQKRGTPTSPGMSKQQCPVHHPHGQAPDAMTTDLRMCQVDVSPLFGRRGHFRTPLAGVRIFISLGGPIVLKFLVRSRTAVA